LGGWAGQKGIVKNQEYLMIVGSDVAFGSVMIVGRGGVVISGTNVPHVVQSYNVKKPKCNVIL